MSRLLISDCVNLSTKSGVSQELKSPLKESAHIGTYHLKLSSVELRTSSPQSHKKWIYGV